MPAKTSSNITPQPPFSFSALFIYNGFTISKKRKSRNAPNVYCHSEGINSSAIHTPTTSSITIFEGSFPHSDSNLLEAMIPKNRNSMMSRPNIIFTCDNEFIISKYTVTPPIAPIVPGAIGEYPKPNAVAINLLINLNGFIVIV